MVNHGEKETLGGEYNPTRQALAVDSIFMQL